MSHGRALWQQTREELPLALRLALRNARRRVGFTLLLVPLLALLFIVIALVSPQHKPSNPLSSLKGDTELMETPNSQTSSSSNANNDTGTGGAASGKASTSSHTNIDVTTNSSGGMTTGSVTVNGKTMPLPKSGSVHEQVDSGNISLELDQSTTSSGSGGSSQQTRVHSNTSTNVDAESY